MLPLRTAFDRSLNTKAQRLKDSKELNFVSPCLGGFVLGFRVFPKEAAL